VNNGALLRVARIPRVQRPVGAADDVDEVHEADCNWPPAEMARSLDEVCFKMQHLEPAATVTTNRAAKRPAHRTRPAEPDLADSALYLNRELSWLSFNGRVLAQARDESHPLLERVKFLGIAANNLDEFHMVGLASLLRQWRAGVDTISPDGLDIDEQVKAVRDDAFGMLREFGVCWEELRPLLAEHDIHFLDRKDYTPEVHVFLKQHFSAAICPVLTPLAFDPGHPFPHISNRSRNLAVVVRHRRRTKFARVKVPHTLPRFVELPRALTGGNRTFVFLEDVVKANIQDLFTGVDIVTAHLFRVIRDTDLVVPERDTDDLLDSINRSLKRVRYGAVSLLEVERDMPKRVLDILMENFEIEEDVVTRSPARMGFADWLWLDRLHRPGLKDPPIVPRALWRRANSDLFEQLKYQDYLVHHPFDSFISVERFIRVAVRDPNVVAIKMTLYRIGVNSPLVNLLIRAANAGKQVAVLVELKARFDERSNIGWANRLEEAGVHVVYGLANLKTHCKVCLVVRQGANGVERYAHLGTGNYNGVTARVYTDLGLFTSEPRLMADLSELFNYLTGYSNQVQYRELLVAPLDLRRRLRALLEREAAHALAGKPAHVVIKVNGLSDSSIIRDLYRASRAGVRIDLIVRGICTIRPGLPGISETITVRSIVGRFLEHSRIFSFENGGEPEVYIGSADLMERNLNRRVETLFPVRDETLRRYLRDTVLDAYLRDTLRAWTLHSDGHYDRVAAESGPAFSSQHYLISHLPPYGADR
jgi:polyphosphate kinase